MAMCFQPFAAEGGSETVNPFGSTRTVIGTPGKAPFTVPLSDFAPSITIVPSFSTLPDHNRMPEEGVAGCSTLGLGGTSTTGAGASAGSGCSGGSVVFADFLAGRTTVFFCSTFGSGTAGTGGAGASSTGFGSTASSTFGLRTYVL